MTNKNKILLTLSFVFLIFSVAFAMIFNGISENNTINKFSKTNLESLSELYASSFYDKMNSQVSLLKKHQNLFTDTETENLQSILSDIKKVHNFTDLYFTDINGNTFKIDNSPSDFFIGKELIKKTISTEQPQISSELISEEKLLLITVPISDDNHIIGVFSGTIENSFITEFMNKTNVIEDNFSFILSENNHIIGSNYDLIKERKAFKNNNDLFTETELSEQSINYFKSKSNISDISLEVIQINGNEYTIIISPIGLNDWSFINILPYNFEKYYRRTVSISVYIVLLLIIIAFAIFTYFLQLLIKINDNTEKDNERLKEASLQSQSLMFEINNNEVTFTGDTEYILNTNEYIFPVDYFFTNFSNHIHPDDKTAIINIKDFLNKTTESFSCEMRFQCADNQYYWFKLSGKTLTKNNSTIVKQVGSFTNVNAQIIHEKELKTIAETDLLTGLLNKNFSEKKIERYMALDNEKSICALFVIDLDNFKQVNDILGHSIGDMAIRDSGKKISLIFSEKDIIGRFGGDEFCVFMCFKNTVSYETAKRIITEKASNLCSILYEDYFNEKNSVTISASIGIAIYPSNGETYKHLFQKADSALYFVKENGKNNYKFYTEGLPELGELIYE